MNTMKLCLLSMTCLCSLLSSCTGMNYQTTASLLSSLSQSAAAVLSARYQVAGYGGASGNNGGSNSGGYDYGQQMSSQQGYAPSYQPAGYSNNGGYQPQQPMMQPMPMPFCQQPQPMRCYYPAYY